MVCKNYFQELKLNNSKAVRHDERVKESAKIQLEEKRNEAREYIEKTFKQGNILEDDYPIYGDYWYFADSKWIRSNVFGTVKDLKFDLQRNGIKCENIYSCVYRLKGE